MQPVRAVRRWIVVLLLAVAAMAVAGCRLPWASQVGVVDIGKIVKQSPRAQRYQSQLNAKYEQISARLKELERLSPAERETREQQAYDEYSKFKKDLEERLDREIDGEIQKTRRKRGLPVVVYKESVRQGGVDITDEIIKQLK